MANCDRAGAVDISGTVSKYLGIKQKKASGELRGLFLFDSQTVVFYLAIVLRHFMQILIRLGVPPSTTFRVRRFGKKIRLLLLCACEMVFPATGRLPHLSHVFDMISTPDE